MDSSDLLVSDLRGAKEGRPQEDDTEPGEDSTSPTGSGVTLGVVGARSPAETGDFGRPESKGGLGSGIGWGLPLRIPGGRESLGVTEERRRGRRRRE